MPGVADEAASTAVDTGGGDALGAIGTVVTAADAGFRGIAEAIKYRRMIQGVEDEVNRDFEGPYMPPPADAFRYRGMVRTPGIGFR